MFILLLVCKNSLIEDIHTLCDAYVPSNLPLAWFINIQLQMRSLTPSGTSEAHLWDECRLPCQGISRVVDGWRQGLLIGNSVLLTQGGKAGKYPSWKKSHSGVAHAYSFCFRDRWPLSFAFCSPHLIWPLHCCTSRSSTPPAGHWTPPAALAGAPASTPADAPPAVNAPS